MCPKLWGQFELIIIYKYTMIQLSVFCNFTLRGIDGARLNEVDLALALG